MDKKLTIREAARAKQMGTVRKLDNYYDEYEFHFAPLRSKFAGESELSILEIGVQDGGSLYMWQKYFPNVRILGVDIDPACKKFDNNKNVRIEIGDQADEDFLKNLNSNYGPFDVIIDDGGHTMKQQLTSFRILFPLLKEGGIYVIEDIHTSYWHEFGGAFNNSDTAVGMIKSLIDSMHYWAVRNPRATLISRAKRKLYTLLKWQLASVQPRNIFEEYVKSIHIADSIVFIYKQKVEKDKVRRM